MPATNHQQHRGQQPHPGTTSTTTPAGIRQHDPDALEMERHEPLPGQTDFLGSNEHGCDALGGKPIGFTSTSVALDAIDTSQNPRTEFPAEAIRALAHTIHQQGLLVPVLVRPLEQDRCELIDGGRRLAAVALLGWDRVPVRVAHVSAEQAAAMRLSANLQRSDLTPIDEARGFRAALDRFGWTHDHLARLIGASQPHIANRLRLLKLPEEWQQRIRSGTLPPTHARALIKYAEAPTVLAKCSEWFFSSEHQPLPTASEFEEAVLEVAIQQSQPLDDPLWCRALGRTVPPFTATPEQLELLGVIECEGKRRATNTKLWLKLQSEHEAALAAAEGTTDQAEPGDDGGQDDGGPDQPENTATAAGQLEQVAAQAEEAQSKAELAFAQNLAQWRLDWLRMLLADAVLSDVRLALAVILLKADQACLLAEYGRIPGLLSVDEDATSEQITRAIAKAQEPAEILLQVAADACWGCPEGSNGPYRSQLDDEAAEIFAEVAQLDLEAHWRQDLAGMLTEAYFNLHTRGQLQQMADELLAGDPMFGNGRSKAQLIELLLNSPSTRAKLPAEIVPVVTTEARAERLSQERKRGKKS